MDLHLQAIIGTDKKNPHFTVFRDIKNKQIHFYFGAGLFEIIPDQKDHPQLRLLVARLRNSGISFSKLSSAFGYCYRSINKWANALNAGDLEKIISSVEGHKKLKLTNEVQGYVSHRFKNIYPTNKRNYSQIIRNEISEIFSIKISGECLRPLFNELKKSFNTQQLSEENETQPICSIPSNQFPTKEMLCLPVSTECFCEPLGDIVAKAALETPTSVTDTTYDNFEDSVIFAEKTVTEVLTTTPITNQDNADIQCDKPVLSQPLVNTNYGFADGFCYYVGILVFAPFLSYLHYSGFGFLIQWIVSVLLGAQNIEQTKKLNFPSLKILLGNVVKNTKSQRVFLKANTTPLNIRLLLRLNINLVGITDQSDFYYDPHSKHYTGLRNLLKGWCSKLKKAGKTIYMDFIHSCKGYPLYLNIVDNYDDMRIRFFRDIESFRTIANISKDKVLTFVVDRAIFSMDTFLQVIRSSNIHLITWEKDYKKDKWNKSNSNKTKKDSFFRMVNNFTEKKLITYSYQEQKWDKNPDIRQIIVRIPTPKGKTIIEVSILTDDIHRKATEIIYLMFNRWIQENDFKYLIAHFGIDQITSYEYFDYQQIKKDLKDKEYTSGIYKSLTKEIDSIRGKLKTVLYKLHRLDKRAEIKNLTKKQRERKSELEQQQLELYNQLKIKEDERGDTEKKVSKIEELIAQKKQKLNSGNKLMMDVIKVIARNIFYLTFTQYRKLYNDKRDDLFIFRELSRSSGIIKQVDNELVFELTPQMSVKKNAIEIISNLINNINKFNPELSNNNKILFRLKLAENVDQMFAFAS